MKPLFLTVVFFIGCAQGIQSQVMEDSRQTSQELFDFHTKKKKQNLTAAFITLGTGTALFLGGIKKNVDNCLFSDCDDGKGMTYAGVAVGLTSFYFFERAGYHKKQAKIQLQSGVTGLDQKINYSGISITLSF